MLPVPLGHRTDTGAGLFRVSADDRQSTGDLRRRQVKTFKHHLTVLVQLRMFKGKSGHYSGGYVAVPGLRGSVMLQGAGPLPT